jgi:hypothetical protein
VHQPPHQVAKKVTEGALIEGGPRLSNGWITA